MRILFFHFHTFKLPRGIETLVLSLANELSKTGNLVSILAGSQVIQPLIKPLPSVSVHKSPKFRWFEKQIAIPYFVWHLLWHRYDRVVVFFADFGEKEALKLAGLFKKIHTVLYLCYPFSSVPHRYYNIKKAGWAKSTDTILADARWIADEAVEYFGRPVGVVPVGTDLVRFKPNAKNKKILRADLSIGDDEIVLLHVGALEHRKGVHRVIRAMADLKGLPLRYFVLGAGPDENDLKQLTGELGIRERVIFGGVVSNLELYYQMADVFVMVPDAEGNSVASIEAMSCELPLIVSGEGGYRESVTEAGAIFVNQNEHSEIVKAISTLLENAPLRKEMGRQNREHVMNNYSWQSVARQFEELIA
jgi:glycosyltransferase involved in cell wall biosynthesis